MTSPGSITPLTIFSQEGHGQGFFDERFGRDEECAIFFSRAHPSAQSHISGSVANRSEEARLCACEVEWLRRPAARELS